MAVIKINKDKSNAKIMIGSPVAGDTAFAMSNDDQAKPLVTTPLIVSSKITRKHFTRLRMYWRQGTYHARPIPSNGDNVDLDLVGHGLIERIRDGNQWYADRVYFRITAKGEQALFHEKGNEISRRSPHHELGNRLAEYLRSRGRVTWENVQFEVEYLEAGKKVHAKTRPDVFSMMATYNTKNMKPIVHEVKVRRSDFLVDRANERKRENYKLVAEKFYYVCPRDLIQTDEVPEGCGLIYEMSPKVFRTVKNSKAFGGSLRPQDWMSLVLKGGQSNNIYEQ